MKEKFSFSENLTPVCETEKPDIQISDNEHDPDFFCEKLIE